jgi:hypothetical protein
MMDLQTIISLNKKAGREARKESLEPKVLSQDEIVELQDGNIKPISSIPYLGTHVPSGWKKFNVNKYKDHFDFPSWWYGRKILRSGELWCDSSGFGAEDEPALTVSQFLKCVLVLLKINPKLGFGLHSTGQFQNGVRVFDNDKLKEVT